MNPEDQNSCQVREYIPIKKENVNLWNWFASVKQLFRFKRMKLYFRYLCVFFFSCSIFGNMLVYTEMIEILSLLYIIDTKKIYPSEYLLSLCQIIIAKNTVGTNRNDRKERICLSSA